MVVPFGWSAGDVIAVCVVLTHVIKAFDDAKGASKHYRDSRAFLCGFQQIVNYISNEEKAASLPEEAKSQIQTIKNAYEDFDAYVFKYVKLEKSEKSRLQSILPTIKWTMNELNDKVQKMKVNSLSAISVMEMLIVMNLSSRVNTLLIMGDLQEKSHEKASSILTDLHGQLSTLSQASEHYRQLIDDTAGRTGTDSNIERQNLQSHLDDMSRSQNELQDKLDKLIKHAEEKSQTDEHEAEQWKKLLAESQLAKDSWAPQEGVDRANELIGGMGIVTGNSQISNFATRMPGIKSIVGALTPSSGRVKKPSWWRLRNASSTETRTSTDHLPADVRSASEDWERQNVAGPAQCNMCRCTLPEHNEREELAPRLPLEPTGFTSSPVVSKIKNFTIKTKPSHQTASTPAIVPSATPQPLPLRDLPAASSFNSGVSTGSSPLFRPMSPQSVSSSPADSLSPLTTPETLTPMTTTATTTPSPSPKKTSLVSPSSPLSSPSRRPAIPPKPARLSSPSVPTNSAFLGELKQVIEAKA